MASDGMVNRREGQTLRERDIEDEAIVNISKHKQAQTSMWPCINVTKHT